MRRMLGEMTCHLRRELHLNHFHSRLLVGSVLENLPFQGVPPLKPGVAGGPWRWRGPVERGCAAAARQELGSAGFLVTPSERTRDNPRFSLRIPQTRIALLLHLSLLRYSPLCFRTADLGPFRSAVRCLLLFKNCTWSSAEGSHVLEPGVSAL